MWRQAGRDLKALADDFARSEEREQVRRRADSVNVNSLDSAKFLALLNELFDGGNRITRCRIVALFFFCSDIAIKVVKSKMEGFLAQLTLWTLKFIKEKVSPTKG